MLEDKLTALNKYIRKMEKSQNKISHHLRKLEKGKKNKPKTRRGKEIISKGAEINETKTEKQQRK